MKVLDQLPLPLLLWKQKSETLHNDFRYTKKFKFCNTLSITNWLSGFQDDWWVILTHQSFSLEASHFLRTTALHPIISLWNNIDSLLNPQMWLKFSWFDTNALAWFSYYLSVILFPWYSVTYKVPKEYSTCRGKGPQSWQCNHLFSLSSNKLCGKV